MFCPEIRLRLVRREIERVNNVPLTASKGSLPEGAVSRRLTEGVPKGPQASGGLPLSRLRRATSLGEGGFWTPVVHNLFAHSITLGWSVKPAGFGSGNKTRAATGRPYTLQQNIVQLFSWKLAPQPRQVTVILPLPRGTLSCWPQLGHLK